MKIGDKFKFIPRKKTKQKENEIHFAKIKAKASEAF